MLMVNMTILTLIRHNNLVFSTSSSKPDTELKSWVQTLFVFQVDTTKRIEVHSPGHFQRIAQLEGTVSDCSQNPFINSIFCHPGFRRTRKDVFAAWPRLGSRLYSSPTPFLRQLDFHHSKAHLSMEAMHSRWIIVLILGLFLFSIFWVRYFWVQNDQFIKSFLWHDATLDDWFCTEIKLYCTEPFNTNKQYYNEGQPKSQTISWTWHDASGQRTFRTSAVQKGDVLPACVVCALTTCSFLDAGSWLPISWLLSPGRCSQTCQSYTWVCKCPRNVNGFSLRKSFSGGLSISWLCCLLSTQGHPGQPVAMQLFSPLVAIEGQKRLPFVTPVPVDVYPWKRVMAHIRSSHPKLWWVAFAWPVDLPGNLNIRGCLVRGSWPLGLPGHAGWFQQ